MTSYVGYGAWYDKKVQNIPLIILISFNHDQIFLETKFQGLKRQVSGKNTEKWHNDVPKWRRTLETGQKCLSDDDDQLHPCSKFHKIQGQVLKTV